jgi:hypothetical protein
MQYAVEQADGQRIEPLMKRALHDAEQILETGRIRNQSGFWGPCPPLSIMKRRKVTQSGCHFSG